MSATEPSLSDLKQRLQTGELSPDEFREIVRERDDLDDRLAIWVRFSEQGLFERAIEQSGFTSFKRGLPREVENDG